MFLHLLAAAVLAYSLLVGACAGAGAPGEPGDPAGEDGVAAAPGEKDRDELLVLKQEPRACEDTADCPSGSRCDEDSETCDWDCIADSDCGPGLGCDARGSCVSRATFYKADNLPACVALPAGEKRILLLGDGTEDVPPLNERQVACTQDTGNENDDCPCGAYCSVDAQCRVDCLQDNPPPEYQCGAGETCSVTGRCVAAGEPPSGPPLEARLEVAPAVVSANTVAGASALIPVTVHMVVNSVEFLRDSHPAKVRYSFIATGGTDNPDTMPSPLVSCAPSGAGPLERDCSLDGGWRFNLGGNNFRSQPRTIWVKIPQSTVPLRWLLVARSESAAEPATVAVNAAPVAFPPTDTGTYRGEIVWGNTGAPAGSAALSLPVEVVVTDNHIAFFEPTRIFLPEGRVTLARDPSKVTSVDWLTSDLPPAGKVHYNVYLNLNGSFSPGRFEGDLEVEAGPHLDTLLFELDRTGDVTAPSCSAGGGCAAGLSCDTAMNLCLPGSAPVGARIVDRSHPSATPSESLVAEARWTWNGAVDALRADSMLAGNGLSGFGRAYCYQPGQSAAARFGAIPGMRPGPAGDLACSLGDGTQPHNQTTFPFANRSKEVDLDPDGTRRFDLIEACREELASAPPQGAITRANTLDTARRCVSVAQFFLAARAQSPAEAGPLNEPQLRHHTQLLRQWLGVNAYVARSTVQNRKLEDAFGRAPANARLAEAVDLVDRGLRVLLDPTIRTPFVDNQVAATVAVQPDYRKFKRPVARWTLNRSTLAPNGLYEPADGTSPFLLQFTPVFSDGIRTNGVDSFCTSTHVLSGVFDRRFSIAFYFEGHLLGTGPVRLFESGEPNSSRRLWVEAMVNPQAPDRLRISLKDSDGNAAHFGDLPKGTTGFSDWGFLAFTADNGTYKMYYAQKLLSGVQSVTATSVVGGGPRWNFQGGAGLGCSVPKTCASATCTSWDRNVAGDGLDVVLQAPFQELVGPFEVAIQSQRAQACNTAANHRRSSLMTHALPGWPPTAFHQFGVSGSPAAPGNPFDCRLTISNLPVPVTGTKPACGCAGVAAPYAPAGMFYDELSVWDRPLSGEEFADMVARYNFNAVNESVVAPTAISGEEQSVGLAAHVVEAAVADLDLLHSYLTATRAATYGECYLGGPSPARDEAERRAGANLRLISLLGTQAAELASRPGANTAPWFQRYLDNLVVLAGRRAAVVQELRLLRECKNPLGVTEDELPLYVGAGIGTQQQFFASTHFLAELAQNQIRDAQSALLLAQDGFKDEIQTEFARDLDVVQQNALVERHKVTYEGVLRRLCGAPAGDARLIDRLLDGTLDASKCFIKLERPECQNVVGLPLQSTPPACLRGEIGERLLAVQAAAIDQENAKRAVNRAIDRFDADNRYCLDRDRENQVAIELLELHRELMQSSRDQQSLMNNVFDIGGMVVKAAAAVYAGELSAAFSGGGLQALANRTFTEDRERSQAFYDTMVSRRALLRDSEACFHEVDNHRFAIEAAFDVMERARHTAAAALFGIAEARQTLDALMIEASGQVARELSVRRRPPHLHHWLDDRIDEYNRQLAVARRLTYLAVRAYEYENQQTSAFRASVLTARIPSQLKSVADFLFIQTQPFSGGPFHVGPGKATLSLRDDILKLEDLAGNPSVEPGEAKLTPTEVLRTFLTSDAAKIYRDDGTLLGRGVRFSVKTDESWNRNSCAERLVRVTAWVSGAVPRPSFPNVLLIHDNAFGTQVCGPSTEMAIVRVGDSTSLVKDERASPDNHPHKATSSLELEYPPDAVRSRADLDSLPVGEAQHLAGRGLYSNYVLVFQDAPPCQTGASGNLVSCQGWAANALAAITDVFLRFDYVKATEQNQQAGAAAAKH